MYNNLPVETENELLYKAINFMRNTNEFGEYMLEVINKWTIACEQNLTNTSINRIAWIGQAACCLAIGCPEHITRKAWHYLEYETQRTADKKAEYAIKLWEIKQEEFKQLTLLEDII